MSSIEIKNIREFQQLLDDLNVNIKKQVMKKGYKEAAQPLITQTKVNIGDKERIKKSLGVRYIQQDNTAKIGFFTAKKKAGFMASWFEEGTKDRQYYQNYKKNLKLVKGYGRKRLSSKGYKVHKTGALKAEHFFSRALEATEKQVFDNLYNTFIGVFDKIVAKHQKMK